MIAIDDLKFDEKGLIPAIVQDADSGRVLTLAYMNRESLGISLERRLTCFWSRSRQELWLKGETSGNYQHIVSIAADCDRDCLLILAVPSLSAVFGADGARVTGVFAMSMVGACLGFLRYNRYPAKTFMGDTGSMLLGGGTVAMAMLLRLPLLLLLTFFTPVMSSVSVILQRYYFKLTHGKRIFLMSPIHHHFEKKGYSETQIVSMYAGVTLVLSLIAVLSIL